MLNIRLLTIEELKKHHTQKTTDFAYLIGAWQTEKLGKYQLSPLYNPEEDFVDSPRFSSTVNGYGLVSSFYRNGVDWAFQHEKDMSCPLVLTGDFLDKKDNFIFLNKRRLLDENDTDIHFLFGAYPQTVVSKAEADKLEQKFADKTLIKTKNAYTYFGENIEGGYLSLQLRKCFEYELDGKRYVRIIPERMHFLHAGFELSDGQKLEQGKPYWVEVEPLKCTIFREKYSDNPDVYLDVVPIAGITWDKIPNFLTKCFSKEIIQSHDFCLKQYRNRIATKIHNSNKKINTVKIHD